MKTKFLSASILLASFLFARPSVLHAQQATHPYKEMETELLNNVNEYRKSIGARPLKLNIYVSNLAERHSRDMATGKMELGNEGYKERTDKIFTQLKPVYSFAENVGIIKLISKEVLEAWLNNPKQKKNLEGDFNYSGIGIAKSADSFYVTEIFILK